MQYSKHFEHQGITIPFDTLELNKEYPTFYVATRGNTPRAYIPIRKIKVLSITNVSSGYKVVSFGFDK